MSSLLQSFLNRIPSQKTILIATIIVLTIRIDIHSQPTSQTFTSNTTFTVPPNVTQLTIECWGAGGGGSTRSTSGRGGGGGGGAYAQSTISVVPGATYNIVVGSGGAANTAGGNSSFGGTLVIAAGGSGGTNNSNAAGAGGTITASTGTIRYAGGNGANGGGTYSGGGGGGAGSTGNGGAAPDADANNGAAGTGTTVNGGTGGTGINGNANGNPGNTYGGGGGGARRTSGTRTGGSGANGLVVVSYVSSVVITTDGFFFIPAGVTRIKVETWGGGGGGASRTSNGRGGGGGGGAYASSIVTVVPGDAYEVVVGAGGAAGTAGEASSFGTSLVVAAGGSGATNNSTTAGNGGTIAASTGTVRYAGGNGADGGASFSGGGGGGAGSSGTGGHASGGTAGAGTDYNGGTGGAGVSTNNTNGNPGSTYGGGGSGAKRTSSNVTGGSGAAGLVIITLPSTVTLSSASQVADGSVYQGTVKWPVFSFEATAASNNAILTDVSFTSAGTYTGSDLSRFQLWYAATNDFSSAIQLGSDLSSGLGTGSHSFTGLNREVYAGSTGYFWITADINSNATPSATLSINAMSSGDLTFELATVSGNTSAGGEQTIMPVPRVTLASSGQVTAGTVNQGAVGHQLFRFTTAVTTANATMSSLSFVTAGTFAAIDVVNFRIWYNTTNDFTTALQVGSPVIGSLGTGTHTFSGLNVNTAAGITGYFWITTDIAPFPTSGRTISVNAITTSDIGYTVAAIESGSTSAGGAQTITTVNGVLLTSTFPAVSANSILQGATGQRVFKFSTIITGSAVTLTSLSFTTSGTYVAGDLVNFKLLYNTINSMVGATQLGSTLTTGLGTGTHTISGFSRSTAAGATGYFWITADIAAAAGSGHTLIVNAITTANLGYSGSPTKTGSTYAGGVQTVQLKVDAENDGVADLYDLDDDNDGIPDNTENLPCNNTVAELFPNSNFEAGNTGFYTGYVYATGYNSLYPEGTYTVTDNANSVHDNFQECPGHGNMMVVNGSSNANLIVWSSGLIAVTPNTDYTLTINLTSVNPANPAQLIFNVNGENIGLQFNATTTNCEWISGIATWNSGSNTSATFDILNLNLIAGGNDFAIDDISCKYRIDCDSDGDGVSDKMDRDSDNDGIYDVVEAGGTAAADGTISGYTDLDLDGLSDNVDNISSGSGGTDIFNGTPLPNPDTDTDDLPNMVDLDSDADACYDVREAGFLDGDTDGLLGTSPVTVNTNGLVTSGTGYTTPQDANSDGTRDYVQQLPVITTQPVDRSICIVPASGTTFSVTATNTGGTYQWQVSTSASGPWSNISNGGVYSGATTATLTISNAVTTTYDGYRYRVQLSNNAYQCAAVTSSAVTLRVSNGIPVLSGTITGDNVVCPSTTGLTYSIASVATAHSYTWTVPAGWTIQSGQNTNSVTVSSGASGGTVSVTATNSCGTSAAVNLAVSINTPTPTFTAPVAATVCQSVDLTYTTQSGKTNYYWAPVGTAGLDYTITSGGGTSDNNLVLKWLTTGSRSVNLNYTSGGCQAASQVTKTISVIANAIIVTQPADPAAICASAGTASMSVSASGSVSSYQWQVSTDGGTSWSNISNTAPYSNTGTNTLTITNPGAGLNGYRYHCVVTGTCGAVTSNSATLTIHAAPATPGTISGTATQCPGLTGQIYSIDAVTQATTYTWSVPSGWAVTAGAGTTGITVTTGSAGQNGNITVTAGNTCGTSAAASLPVTVNPGTPSQPGAITGTAAQCPGATGQTYSISAVSNATTYTWSVPTGWSVTGGAGTTEITVTAGTTGQNGNITVTAGNSCGTSTAATLAVSVVTVPVIANKSATVYSGTAFTVTPVNGTDVVPPGTTYSWPLPVVTGGITGGATGTGANSITGTLNNPSSSAQTATYTVTPSASGCSGATFTVTVTVNAIPDIDDLTASTCSGSGFSVTPADGTNGTVPSGTTYSWAAPAVTGGITGGAPGTGANSISGTLANPTNTVQTATYTITPTTGSYTGNTFSVTLTLNPVATVSSMTHAVCSGTGFSVTPVQGTNGSIPAGTVYNWSAPAVTGGLTGGGTGTGSAVIAGILVNPTATAQTAVYTVTPESGTCTGSDFTLTLTVNALPVVTITGENKVCEGTTTSLDAESGFAGYQWYKDATALGTSNTQVITTGAVNTSAPVTESYSVTVTDANGCVSTTQHNISVYHKPETGPEYYVPNNIYR